MEVVLDIETDGLDATEILCIVAKERESGKIHVWNISSVRKACV